MAKENLHLNGPFLGKSLVFLRHPESHCYYVNQSHHGVGGGDLNMLLQSLIHPVQRRQSSISTIHTSRTRQNQRRDRSRRQLDDLERTQLPLPGAHTGISSSAVCMKSEKEAYLTPMKLTRRLLLKCSSSPITGITQTATVFISFFNLGFLPLVPGKVVPLLSFSSR